MSKSVLPSLEEARDRSFAVSRGERIRQLVEAQVSALEAVGRHLDDYDKVLMANAAIEVLYPAVAVDLPGWK